MDSRELIINFIENNLIIGRFPSEKDINDKYKDINVIINVSDEFYLGNSEYIIKKGVLNYYFPLGETSKNIGISSIYGAMQVLHQIFTWNPEWKVLIHCQAGYNRSPLIKAAFYYMMLDEHLPDISEDGLITKPNKLLYNCEKGYLPNIKTMQLFLYNCNYAFNNSNKFFGGMYDWVIDKSSLNE